MPKRKIPYLAEVVIGALVALAGILLWSLLVGPAPSGAQLIAANVLLVIGTWTVLHAWYWWRDQHARPVPVRIEKEGRR